MRCDYIPPSWAQTLSHPPTARLQMVHGPTPIQAWHPPGLPDDVQCWIKRDDLTGMVLSGNKVRKLEFLLADAQTQGCDIVLTCGGLQSNHCRSTAAAARLLGMDTLLLLRTDAPQSPLPTEGNILLNQLVGAQMIPISREQYTRRTELLGALANDLRSQGRRPYIIPEGGSNALGTWGYIEAIRELAIQLQQQALDLDDIVFACGSGGTAAGLSLGAHLAGLGCRIHAVNVCDDAQYFYQIMDGIFRELGHTQASQEVIDIIDGYKGRGYSLNTPEERQYILDIARHTGVLLDPVYSGKAMVGLADQLHNNPARFQGKKILFIHTGGLFGLLAKANEWIPQLAEQTWHRWADQR